VEGWIGRWEEELEVKGGGINGDQSIIDGLSNEVLAPRGDVVVSGGNLVGECWW
jgi:hypothetical protein